MGTNIQNNGETLEIAPVNKTTTATMPPKKKASRGVHVFSVVMHMLRRRRRRKPFNTGFWRRVVDSVRKARSEITIMPPSPNFMNNTIYLPPPPTHDDMVIDQTVQEHGVCKDKDTSDSEEGIPEVVEIFTAATSSSSSGISGYGSAMSLRDLGYHDGDEDEEDDDECFSDIEEGDDMIDEKAEEFIVRFYEQMKMQNQVYTQRSNKAKGINSDY